MSASGFQEPIQVRGLLLFIGDTGALGHLAQAVQSLGEVTVVSRAEAATMLAQVEPDVIITDQEHILSEVVANRPLAVPFLVGRHSGTGALAEREVTALPTAPDLPTFRALCAVALRCAAARRAARDLDADNQRLRGIGPEPPTDELEQLSDLERYEGLIARSPTMKRALSLLRNIEGSDTSVLVQGETGTGKELVAQAIHARSRRRNARFVAVNLGAISDPLRESELFGHVRGAFTGATDARGGLFVEANGGCIFLDEVGDASPGLQVALLRVLEEGIITPVGSDRPRKVDVRIISGTNRNLEEMVRHGLFRRDLYYRLHVFPIELPPLRDRPEDIFPLATHFLAQASLAMGKKPPGISREARAVLESYHWEGNVRELRNVMERGAILCKGGLVIAADLPMGMRGGPGQPAGAAIAIPPGGATLAQLEREIFVRTLAIAGGNQSRAARILGLRESTFRFRLQKLGITSRRASMPSSQTSATSQRIANAS